MEKDDYENWWCLVIDADEIVEDLWEVKEFIQVAKPGVYSPKMRHLIGDLKHEDDTRDEHFVLHRLFKILNADKYPEVEHPVLIPKQNSAYGGTDCTTIWHLAYIPGMFEIKKRYDNHMKKSQMHTKEFLRSWYFRHLFGRYPVKSVEPLELPQILLDHFGVGKDELYFATHKVLEVKHFLMMQQWTEKFKPKSILDLGCGMGMYGFVAGMMKIPYIGIELSKYAVEQNPYSVNIKQGDITKKQKEYGDLVLAIDVLEHIDYKDLDETLKLISKYGNHYLFSVPYLGDPNLDKDPTHIIKETKEWWIEKLSKYFKIWEVTGWLFSNQLLIGDPR